MAGNPETLTNAAGVVVFEGTTSESGGAQPGIIPYTFTAAEVAARFDGDPNFASAMELPGVTATMWIVGIVEVENTLDNDTALNDLVAFDPGGSTADIFASGPEGLITGSPGSSISPGTYGNQVQFQQPSNLINLVAFLNAGKAAYATYSTSVAPTTGSSTVLLFVGGS